MTAFSVISGTAKSAESSTFADGSLDLSADFHLIAKPFFFLSHSTLSHKLVERAKSQSSLSLRLTLVLDAPTKEFAALAGFAVEVDIHVAGFS